jgi:hypothetical protein
MTRDEARGMRRFTAFSGLKMLIEPAERFSQKKLGEVADNAPRHPEYERLIQHVADRNGLTIED